MYVKVRHMSIKYVLIYLLAALLMGCSQNGTSDHSVATAADRELPQEVAQPEPTDIEEVEPNEPIPPEHLVLSFREGETTEIDARTASKQGLTVVDLRDGWAPRVLRGTEELPSTYEPVYIGLANEQGDPVDWADPRTADYYLEVYGIQPSFSTIKRRLDSEQEMECFNDLDYESLENFEGFLAYRAHSKAQLKLRAAQFKALERRVEAAMKKQGVENPSEITGEAALLRQWNKIAPARLAIRAAQERLACEKLFPGRRARYVRDAFDWATHIGLLNFERRHRFYGWGFLNEETAEALSWNPEETALHTIERALTERVVDASGIIEDGSVNRRDGTAPTYTGADGAEHEVRNLVEEFSQAAMQHLGLTTPEAAVAFLAEHDFENFRVALPLPELPEYYSEHMDLEVVINRGDVWYDFPYDEEGNETVQPRSRRPTNNLYVNYLEKRIPLSKYGTTIGGWRSTMRDGVEHWAYKNSDIGARVWRRIVGAPSWIPPQSTPIRTLVTKRRRRGGRRYEINYAELGPGYASAYGMVMGIHESPVERDGETLWRDNGIRSHGSVNYQSIQKRHSHGCHRLHNHLALRLFGYVLAHRNHKRLGQEMVSYGRAFEYEGQKLRVSIKTRGHHFEMEPPVPVMVTRGRVLGIRQTPHTDYIMKPSERERLEREAAEAALADAGVAGDGSVSVGDAGPLSPSSPSSPSTPPVLP